MEILYFYKKTMSRKQNKSNKAFKKMNTSDLENLKTLLLLKSSASVLKVKHYFHSSKKYIILDLMNNQITKN